MCVIFWTTKNDYYDLVIASNRDEFLSRPTLPASWHDFSSSSSSSSSPSSFNILSARDATGGGTWLGITRNGSFATLTNFTELSAPLPEGLDVFESRGNLVRDWLSQSSLVSTGRQELQRAESEVRAYLEQVGAKLDRFPGFNLLIASPSLEGTVVGYITNRTASGSLATDQKGNVFPPRAETPAGMSNSILSQPWTKVTNGSNTFSSILDQPPHSQDHLVENLFDLLWTSSNPKPTQRSDLRNSLLISPLELPAGKQKDWYATRTSTVILVAKDGHAKLVERDTFTSQNGQALRVNGPDGTGAVQGRSGGQRVFDWKIK